MIQMKNVKSAPKGLMEGKKRFVQVSVQVRAARKTGGGWGPGGARGRRRVGRKAGWAVLQASVTAHAAPAAPAVGPILWRACPKPLYGHA
jgi:hypothetical protein